MVVRNFKRNSIFANLSEVIRQHNINTNINKANIYAKIGGRWKICTK